MSEDRNPQGRLVRRLLGLALKYRGGCARLVALQATALALGVFALRLSGEAIDSLASLSVQPRSALAGCAAWLGLSAGSVWNWVVALAGLIVVVAACRAAVLFFYAIDAARLLQRRIVVDLRAAVFEKLQYLGPRFYGSVSGGALISRATDDVQSVRMFIDGVLLQWIVLAMSLACFLAYMLRIHAGLTLACLATTPALWRLLASFSRTLRPAYDRNRELVDRMLMVVAENLRGVHVVKGFAREDEELAKFRAANGAVLRQQRWTFLRISILTPSVELLLNANMAVLLGYGGWLTMEGRLDLGSGLVVFAGLLQQFSAQVSKINNLFNSLQQSLAGSRRVFELLDAPIEIRDAIDSVAMPQARGEVVFDRVSVAHSPGRFALRDVALRVSPGQCVAVLGATGEGKTTLLHAIARFVDVSEGCVSIDGVDVRRIRLCDLRRNVGVVFQETFLFSDTVAANIAWYRPEASRLEIERAARIASADGFIAALPEGYDTVLAEGGKNLSGGQRQRLAIARAVLADPPILVFDDPTAAIDPQTEGDILAAIDRVMRGRTTFVVAHRLSTLKRADLVIVLQGGRIVESGRHEELMARGGVYWEAARLQLGDDVAPCNAGLPVRPTVFRAA